MRNRVFVIGAMAALTVLGLGACTTDPTSGAAGTYSPDPAVVSARMTQSFGTVGGAPFRLYTIRFIALDSCESPALASFEIDIASDGGVPPVGDILLRTSDPPTAVPSAIQRSGAATIDSGTLTLTAATGTLLDGSLTAMATIDGVATPVTASFIAPICP